MKLQKEPATFYGTAGSWRDDKVGLVRRAYEFYSYL